MLRPRKTIFAGVMAGLTLLLAAVPTLAQPAGKPETFKPQVTGVPGSPSATTTISGKQLPAPDPKFGGVIKEDYTQSKPWWPPRVVPPKGAPNVLLIMTDDQGYAVPSTFGGVIPTPALDRLAQNGLRYTQMHSTALCSPTRAGLITGRNHHSAGFGVVTEISTGYPGYDSILPKDKATIGTILRDNGYATSWFGKNHNTPMFTVGATGPFDQWPSGMGFQYFYGFVGGETDQWTPFLFRNHTQIFPWRDQPGFNLTTAMADDAIQYMRQMKAESPDQPFFIYYVPGGTHAPHQPTKEWIDKISAMHLFDKGWNDLRNTIFANQKRLGVVPANAQLTPWPDSGAGKLPRWDTLSDEQKKLYIKQADVFAAYVAYTDHEIGRVIQEIENEGKLDNTLIIFISGDNGTSAEGTMTGTFNDLLGYNGVTEVPMAANMARYDNWGAPGTAPHMAVPWAWAFDTPFQWTKQIASHFGGTRQGMAISWPAVIKDKGGIRTQFAHVIDVVPTILEATKIQAPQVVDGIKQAPIEGVSLMYTFDQANANVPTRHRTQYFEMGGYRGIYHDGWYANTIPPIAPWSPVLEIKLPDPLAYKWELYNLNEDYSQANDLAAKYPDKLKEMQKVFTKEAWKYNVFPLDNRAFVRSLTPRPSATAGVSEFTYSGEISGISPGGAPPVLGRSFTITADIDVPQGGAEGMLVTDGGETGGYGLYLLKGTPVFTYNLLAMERFRWQAPAPLTPGKHTVVFDFTYDGPGLAKGGTGVLRVDGKDVDTKKIPHTIPFIYLISETFDVGVDTRTGVNDADYRVPFRFTGTINKLTLKPGPEQFTAADRQKAGEAKARAND
jgi:arylsulfatase A-like enzyme